MLYKGLKSAASIPTDDLVPATPPPPPRRSSLPQLDMSEGNVRKHHSLVFQTPFANTNIYKSRFFPPDY